MHIFNICTLNKIKLTFLFTCDLSCIHRFSKVKYRARVYNQTVEILEARGVQTYAVSIEFHQLITSNNGPMRV